MPCLYATTPQRHNANNDNNDNNNDNNDNNDVETTHALSLQKNKNNMTDKFQNKYRIPSTRLQNWDYGQHAAYFVTICTQGRECFLGDVVNGAMNLSGVLAVDEKNVFNSIFPVDISAIE